MYKKFSKKDEGFTIIEVLIVLAIAGLILLVVFLAVPALQRNSRNTRRKQDVSSVLGAISEYASNNNGSLPDDDDSFYEATQGIKLSLYEAPAAGNDLNEFDFTANSNTSVTADVNTVFVKTGAKCSTSGAQNFSGGTASSRNFAVVYAVETGGGTQSVCTES